MKRYNNLYKNVISKDNILLAIQNARKGKSYYNGVQKVNNNINFYIDKLYKMLKTNSFKNSEYKIFTKETGGKQRYIYKLPFYPDRIVHHCIVQVLYPIWMNLLIRDTFSTIPKRGIHDGVYRLKNALKDKENTKYCLKLDIKKFYPSINHDILLDILLKKIKDKELLELLKEIIYSAPGIPIGNYISQWFGNIYLAYFDHFVKEYLGTKYYFRYADDLVLLNKNKDNLHFYKNQIKEYLINNLNLKIKENYQIFPVDIRGIDFLGYRFFHTHTLIRKNIVKNFKSKIKYNNKPTKQTQSAYYGWFKHANSHNLMKKYFVDYEPI